MQLVLPAWSWNWPLMHTVQVTMFLISENVPTSHGVQLRFVLEVPSVSMRVPAEHEAWSMQYVLPALSWNCPSLHVVQLATLATPEKLPARQSAHSPAAVALPTTSTR
jgi:hypothetical protein